MPRRFSSLRRVSSAARQAGFLQGANLGQRGQNARLRLGVIGLAVALALSVTLDRMGVSPLWRLVTFVPFFVAAYGGLQGLFRTCPSHARQGTRESDSGAPLPQSDERTKAASRRWSRLILAMSLGFALAASLLVSLLP